MTPLAAAVPPSAATPTAVLSAGIGAATAVWQVAVVRAGAWTARGLRVPARNALLADVVAPRAYERAYGFERAMDNLGAIGGPLLAIALVAGLGTRSAIGLSVIPGLLAALAVGYAIRHTRAPAQRERKPLRIRIRPVLLGPLRPLFAGIAAFEVGNCAATLLILRATELLRPGRGEDSATTVALVLYVAYNIAVTLVSVPAGRHTDRRGATRVLLLGAGAFTAAYVIFTRDTTSWLLLLPAFVLSWAAIVIPGTMRDSQFILDGLLDNTSVLQPREVMADTAADSYLIHGLFRLLGYQFSPRLADLPERRYWRLNPRGDYGAFNRVATNRIRHQLLRTTGRTSAGSPARSRRGRPRLRM